MHFKFKKSYCGSNYLNGFAKNVRFTYFFFSFLLILKKRTDEIVFLNLEVLTRTSHQKKKIFNLKIYAYSLLQKMTQKYSLFTVKFVLQSHIFLKRDRSQNVDDILYSNVLKLKSYKFIFNFSCYLLFRKILNIDT